MTDGTDDPFALRDDRDYAAALDELDDLALSEPGTPPGPPVRRARAADRGVRGAEVSLRAAARWRRHPAKRAS